MGRLAGFRYRELDTPDLTLVAPAGRLEPWLRSPAADARSAQGVSKLPRVAAKLHRLGWAFDRSGPGSHELWRRRSDGHKVTLPHHSRDFAEGTLRAILREAQIQPDEFLQA